MSLSMSQQEREQFLVGTQMVIKMTPEHWLTADFGKRSG
jgi:hypothetical protein